ncbi:MAG TPA: FadR/GntR family transcriptional regulator [Chloroflexota bacterium]|nr:FadR/GntR family transcriptional regulator [Chloroflexota bacterium]
MVRATRPRAFHAIVDQIRADIFARRRRPGDRLPPEPVLAEQFGVSRMGVREALRVLELQGLVEVRHGYAGGVFVAEPNGTALLGALEDSLRQGQVGADELYQARVLVEPAIARLAVERDAATLAERLADNVARTEQALAGGAPVSALNREFHRIVAEHAGNRVLALMMRALQELLETLDERRPNTPAVSRCALQEHRQLLGAVRAHDGARAERLMRSHLARLEGRVRRDEVSGSPVDIPSLPARRQQRAAPAPTASPQDWGARGADLSPFPQREGGRGGRLAGGPVSPPRNE